LARVQDEAFDVVVDTDSSRIGGDAASGSKTLRRATSISLVARRPHRPTPRRAPACAPRSLSSVSGAIFDRRLYARLATPPPCGLFLAPTVARPSVPGGASECKRAVGRHRATPREPASSHRRRPSRPPRALITRAAIHHRQSFLTFRFHLF